MGAILDICLLSLVEKKTNTEIYPSQYKYDKINCHLISVTNFKLGSDTFFITVKTVPVNFIDLQSSFVF